MKIQKIQRNIRGSKKTTLGPILNILFYLLWQESFLAYFSLQLIVGKLVSRSLISLWQGQWLSSFTENSRRSQPKGHGRDTNRDGIGPSPEQLGLAPSSVSRTSDSYPSTSCCGSFCTGPHAPTSQPLQLGGWALHDHPPSQKDITPTRPRILLLC